jgi:predicted membrane protein
MGTMSKIQKEADEYKDSSVVKLRFVILIYKGLSFFSSRKVNFIVSFLHFAFLFWLVVRINFFTVSLLILSHYFIFWKYAILKKNWCLVTPEEGEGIDEIVKILEEYLKDKKTKKPH